MNILLNINWVQTYLLPAIDIAIIAFVIYRIYMMISGTRAIQVVKGLALIIVAAWLSRFLRLETMSWLLNQIIQFAAIALIILFQPGEPLNRAWVADEGISGSPLEEVVEMSQGEVV